MTDAIVVEGLVREFKGGIRAVDGIDLHVRAGEVYGFLGPNGAGKSTTVRMLTTLLRPTGGRASVAGFDVVAEAASVRRAIGVALQDAAIDPFMTGRELLRLQAILHAIPRHEGHARAEELLERVGLIDAADRRVGTYSGGMRRRLDLALALVHEPVVLFLDEPTTGLDPTSRVALWEEVRRLNRESGTTVFLTTQYLEEADQLAGRVGIIDGGKIVAEGTPTELKTSVGDPTLMITPADPAPRRRGRRCPGAVRAGGRRQAGHPPPCGCAAGAEGIVAGGARPRRGRHRDSGHRPRTSRPSTTCSSSRPGTASRATRAQRPARGADADADRKVSR